MTGGLCPACLLELALQSPSLFAEIEAEAVTASVPTSEGLALAPGHTLGGRYRIRSKLGRGGMGEVWRAWDLKLRVDVALKALVPELHADEHAMRRLRQEVRSAREVNSPHVCRVFDLVEVDEREFVSMEYIDGERLLDVLERRAPLGIAEAREIAGQFLAGLEAIHDAGLVHRDIKPENIMITRAGRVVVMDLGIARGLFEGRVRNIVGTPEYMAPEQAAGGQITPRTDVFSAGVVLAEMIAPEGLANPRARRAVWEAVQAEPVQLADSAWTGLIARAVSRRPADRPPSAAALLRGLEEVTLRVTGGEATEPYPGLAAYTSEEADYFFGREVEVETAWKRLQRAHLMALIGPSGAGKSSFIHAGLLPAMPEGWRAVVTRPGSRPLEVLARSLLPELSGDAGAMDKLLGFGDPGVAVELMAGWRRRHGQALLVVDQFEELFTQNPPEVQRQFAELLARLALEANVHVLLSMRDDFLFRCSSHEPLAPIFSETLPLKPLTGAGLRRALVQPALKCGYRPEDDALVESMVHEVHGERGALPLLAFAASRLWAQRDRQQGLLTREAYEEIGGVSGALARHAEETLDAIGREHEPLVRELFRNLVTSQSTRATRDRDELLSVFDPARRRQASKVLDALIDARLLTSYEVAPDEAGSGAEDEAQEHHRIEVIHESLLTAWPRLVRWQSQDNEEAILRDQLRQAAQLWKQRGEPEDLLWTGTSFKEYELWRERYRGGLTTGEEEFARAMTSRAGRNRRRRQVAVAASFTLLVALLAAVGWSWRHSEIGRRQAEAAELLAIAQERLDEDPTEALAFATASLEVVDTRQARTFTARALAESPPALEVELGSVEGLYAAFSPDGAWLAVGGISPGMQVLAASDGSVVELPGHSQVADNLFPFWASDHLLATGRLMAVDDTDVHIWEFPGARHLRAIDVGPVARWTAGKRKLLAMSYAPQAYAGGPLHFRAWNLPDGGASDLGTVDSTARAGVDISGVTVDGDGWWYLRDGEVYVRALPARADVADRLVGRHGPGRLVGRLNGAGRLWTSRIDETGPMLQWDLEASEGQPLRVVSRPAGYGTAAWIRPDDSDRWAGLRREQSFYLWGLDEVWPDARPLHLRRRGSSWISNAVLHPRGDWLMAPTRANQRLSFWPLPQHRALVVDYPIRGRRGALAFSPDSRWLATEAGDEVLLWPTPGSGAGRVRRLPLPGCGGAEHLEFDAQGRNVVLTNPHAGVCVGPLDGAPPTLLGIGADHPGAQAGGAVSPGGQRVAVGGFSRSGDLLQQAIHVWTPQTGEHRTLELPPSRYEPELMMGGADLELAFLDDSTLVSLGDGVLRRWNLATGGHEVVFQAGAASPRPLGALDGKAGRALILEPEPGELAFGRATIVDLASGRQRSSEALAEGVFTDPSLHWLGNAAAISGSIVATGDGEGVIRVSASDAGAPHLLVGHEGPVQKIAISPDGRWIASTGQDGTLRLWPMPDLDEPPFQALPRAELIARLRAMTNVRVERDPESSSGWETYLDPFPGWATVPEW